MNAFAYTVYLYIQGGNVLSCNFVDACNSISLINCKLISQPGV